MTTKEWTQMLQKNCQYIILQHGHSLKRSWEQFLFKTETFVGKTYCSRKFSQKSKPQLHRHDWYKNILIRPRKKCSIQCGILYEGN
jgi:hypothetical protein